MRVYLAIKYVEGHANRDRIEGITAILERHGIATYCVARDLEQWGTVSFDAQALMQKAFQEIDASNLVLVDLTEKGVGVGIEAGYAFAKQIPVMTIAQSGSDISTTIRGISRKVVQYTAYDDLSSFLDDMQL
ncbi:MAG: nucleoside 2-deoxyribosyltransferase [Anaerolineales bacterium]|nr:MAG: nucleoside 2-deoxyribosyltransferase [Anaerolineales bacterium]